jgi:hypothetical protein
MGLRRGEKKKVIVVRDGGFEWDIRKLVRDGCIYRDTLTGKTYPLNGRMIKFKGEYMPILDEETGVTLEPKIDKSVLNLKTNPDLLGRVIDPVILQNAFRIKPELRTIIIALIFGLIIGIILGAPL